MYRRSSSADQARSTGLEACCLRSRSNRKCSPRPLLVLPPALPFLLPIYLCAVSADSLDNCDQTTSSPGWFFEINHFSHFLGSLTHVSAGNRNVRAKDFDLPATSSPEGSASFRAARRRTWTRVLFDETWQFQVIKSSQQLLEFSAVVGNEPTNVHHSIPTDRNHRLISSGRSTSPSEPTIQNDRPLSITRTSSNDKSVSIGSMIGNSPPDETIFFFLHIPLARVHGRWKRCREPREMRSMFPRCVSFLWESGIPRADERCCARGEEAE